MWTRLASLRGLRLLWNNNTFVSLLSYSPGHIDVSITLTDYIIFRFSSFYGNPKTDFLGLLELILNR